MALPKIDKTLAIELRKAGFSYAAIAQYIGCSYQWCAIKLSEVKPDEKLAGVVLELYVKHMKETEMNV